MLRANGFTCDMDQCDRGLKGQFKSADRFHAHFSMIIGEEEVKKEVVDVYKRQGIYNVEVTATDLFSNATTKTCLLYTSRCV